MHFFLLGASHHSAPIDLREQIDFTRRGLSEALETLSQFPDIGEAVILSTCNRSEIYIACEAPQKVRKTVSSFMSTFHDMPDAKLAPHLYYRVDADVARHLFRVTSGLDSLVVGEPQILGQVKEAFSVASEQHYTGTFLNRLFDWSFTAGKRVRTETGLGEGAVSVSYAAVSLARKIFGDLSPLSVLVLGAGEMAELTVNHLRSQRVKRIAVANRTAAHAANLAAKTNGVSVAWDKIATELPKVDIVVTATGSTRPIISKKDIEMAMRPRRDRPLFIIDIGVPRDVDATSGDMEQVFLYNIDDLRSIVQENLARRQSQVDLGELLVGAEVTKFMSWVNSRAAIPTVVALRKKFDAIRLEELDRLNTKLAGLSPETRKKIEEITRRLVEKLLSSPTENLKATTNEQTVAAYTDALNELFDLKSQDTTSKRDAAETITDDATTTSLRGREN